MTLEEIIKKWQSERDRLCQEMAFCNQHKMPHEKEFIYERYNAIGDVLADLRFDLDKE